MHYPVVIASFLLILVHFSGGLELPSYIKPCSKSDPKLSQCAKASASAALPYIVKGDKKYKSPPLNPLHLDAVNVDASDNLKISMKNVVLNGLENIVIDDIKLDLPKNHAVVKVSCNLLNLVGDYNIDGRILILPIKGDGPANLTFTDSSFVYDMVYDLVKKEDGNQYVENIKPTISFEIKNSHFYFGNLFNGDKRLGDQMNNFLNEHQAEVSKDLAPSVSEVISTIVTTILDAFFSRVPYENIYKP